MTFVIVKFHRYWVEHIACQLGRLQWSNADRVGVRLCRFKGDQAHVGSVVAPTRSEVLGPCSELGEGGRPVALLVALRSYHAALPELVLLSSYRSGG